MFYYFNNVLTLKYRVPPPLDYLSTLFNNCESIQMVILIQIQRKSQTHETILGVQ